MSEKLDWPEVHRRLETLREATERPGVLSAEDEARLLKERARTLARDVAATDGERTPLEVVQFALANERYAFPLAAVREVDVIKDLTPVPGTPAFIAGIINRRGEIHTVIDIKKVFDLPASGITELNRVLVLAGEGVRLGILADAVLGVRDLAADELQTALPTLTGIRAEYLRGVTADGLIVLEASRLLADETLVVRHDARTQLPAAALRSEL